MRDIIRSYYRDVVEKLNNTASVISVIDDYPIFYARRGIGQKHILISGGIHGDEPAGTLAALDLISRFQTKDSFFYEFQIHIYPCINPWGYEYHERTNKNGIDLNRDFEEFQSREASIINQHLRDLGIDFNFTLDMHENLPNFKWKGFDLSSNPRGVCLYESCQDHSLRIGKFMIDTLREKGFDICDLDVIYDDINYDGVIWYPENMKNEEYAQGNSFDAFLWKNYTSQAFTTETVTTYNIEDRIRAQHILLMSALKKRI